MSPGRIVVVGSANADLTVTVERRPQSGETVRGSDLAILPGGKGANQAAAAGRLGAEVWFAGCVGTDSNGDLLLTALADAGVDTSAVRRVVTPTGVALIAVSPDGDNSIIVVPGANGDVSVDDVNSLGDLIEDSAMLVLQMELEAPRVEQAVALGRHRGTRVLLNLAPVAQVSPETLATCDPLVVNEHEAAFLLGGPPDDVGDASTASLRRLGARSVVITLGAEGAVSDDGVDVFHVSAPKVRAVDTTGAGDAFIGALAWRLSEGDSLAKATDFAVRVGSTAVLTRGAQTSYPSADEVLPAPRGQR
jgi:ribokinase